MSSLCSSTTVENCFVIFDLDTFGGAGAALSLSVNGFLAFAVFAAVTIVLAGAAWTNAGALPAAAERVVREVAFVAFVVVGFPLVVIVLIVVVALYEHCGCRGLLEERCRKSEHVERVAITCC